MGADAQTEHAPARGMPAVLRPSLSPRATTLLAALVIALTFAYGAYAWATFTRSSGGAAGAFTQADFPAITIASRMVAQGRGADLYSLDAQLDEQRALVREGLVLLSPADGLKYPYPYLPFIAVLLSPLAGAPPNLAWAAWDLLNLAGLALGLWALLSALRLPTPSRLLLFLGGISSFPFIVNLEQGQSSGVIALALGCGLALLKRGRDLPAGLMLGLLILKVQWLPIILLLLLVKRRWRALAGIALTGLALSTPTLLTIGLDWLPGYLQMVARAGRYDRALLLDPWYSHSAPGALAALFGSGADAFLPYLGPALAALAALVALMAHSGPWLAQSARWDGAMALTLLAAMLANPHLNTHDLCLLALAAGLGLSYLLRARPPLARAWYALLWAAYLLPPLFLPYLLASPVRIVTIVMGAMLGLVAATLFRKSPPQPLPQPVIL